MSDNFANTINRFSHVKILIFGDFLLDEFVFGEISRISREAPVLILKYQQTSCHPGGAANAVANASSLGAQVLPVGFLGQDADGDKVLELWPDEVAPDYVIQDSRVQTTRKTRVLAGSFHSYRQQVVRMDFEYPLKLDTEQEGRLAQALTEQIPRCQAVIISDYSLGNVTRYLRHVAASIANEHNVPIIVDSRDDPSGFPGTTSVTPNITEVESCIGQKIGSDLQWLEAACVPLLQEWDVGSLLVTRGKLGMSLIEKGGATHIPVFGAADAVDVTGAGDTVVAAYAAALATGASAVDAASLANYAGGLVVMKKGTATVTAEELKAGIESLQKPAQE